MKKIQVVCLGWALFALGTVGLVGCKTTTGVKKGSGGVVGQPAKVVDIAGCIRGRVTDEAGKGFSSVVVKTEPPTSPQVTNSAGFFEICYKQQLVDADMGESKKVSLPVGSYTLTVVKEGYHAHPVKFEYNGSKKQLEKITMVEKTKPLPQVSETKVQEGRRTSGVGGKNPVGE